jgi:tRNA threonylcarbamoyladenosine biosynthesis protein TsaE
MMRFLADESETLALGRELYDVLPPGALVFLHGDLGAGKTTLVRGFLRAAGFADAVKSPTFTVVEEYHLVTCTVHHFDLYRLGSPDELEWLGFRDYLRGDAICFIEWPERAGALLPVPDLELTLRYTDAGRSAELIAPGPKGLELLDRLVRRPGNALG